jgi:hypothetical protein
MPEPELPKAPVWAGRVPQKSIARLYELNAKGIWDEALIDEVGTAMWARCRDSLRVTEAHRGNAPCPVCDATIKHDWEQTPLICSACGWRGKWRAYLASYQGKQLHAGGMEPYFVEFVEQYAKARSPREKMLLIDLLIHRFHREYTGKAITEGDPGRPGCVNLIGGRLGKVVQFLDSLAYGDNTAPEIRATKQRWRDYVAAGRTKREDRTRRKRHRQESGL